MSNITIKILEVEQSTLTLLIKAASDKSLKSVDEYDAVAFHITDPALDTPEKFINAIKNQVGYYVRLRDASESVIDTIDVTAWYGYVATVDADEVVDPALDSQTIAAQSSPEVEI